MRAYVVLVGVFMAGGAARAEPARLTGGEIRSAILGATMNIDTPIGTHIPIVFAPDGTLSGRAGAMLFFLGASTDNGRWWISGDRLCHKWTTWFHGRAHCLEIRREGPTYYWDSEDGESGTATIVAPPATIAAASTPAPPAQPAPSQSAFSAAAATLPSPAASQANAGSASARPVEHAVPPPPSSAPKRITQASAAAVRVPIPRAKDVAKPVPAPAKLREPPAAVTYRVAGVRSDDVLYVRTGPSTMYDEKGSIGPDGRGVQIVGQCAAEWCPIRHRGLTGWVNSRYLASELTETSATPR